MANFKEPIDTFANRLYKAMTHRGLTQVDLVKRTGISKGSISQYMSGTYVPKSSNIYLLSKALDVSEQYLMGFDVPMDKPKIKNEDLMINVGEDGIYLIRLYNELEGDEKDLLITLAEKLSKKKA